MDILFCSDLGIKEELFVLGMVNLEESGLPITWKSIAKRLEVSVATARKIGNSLRDKNVVVLELQYSDLGGAIPSHLKLNKDELKKHIKKATA